MDHEVLEVDPTVERLFLHLKKLMTVNCEVLVVDPTVERLFLHPETMYAS